MRRAFGPVLAIAGSVAVLAMWLADGGATVSGPGAVLLALGRLTGLEGTYTALLTVLVVSRTPQLDRLLGMESLVRWHRWVGQATVVLLVAHTAFTIWGYGRGAHVGVVHETKVVVLDLPDMLAATVALGVFVAIAIVSVRAARRRLRYQTWYFIHLYTYLALALSFAHQFATGADFASHPVNRWIWGTAYVVVLGMVVIHHVVVPLARVVRNRMWVDRVVVETPSAVSVYLAGPGVRALGGQAGQFLFLRFMTRDRWWEAHPFSLSSVPDGERIRITVTAAGDFSGALGSLRPGTRVLVEGPFGHFTGGLRTKDKVLLIAAGAGIAPIRALFEDLRGEPTDVTLLYRVRDETRLALRDELDALAERTGASVHYLPGPREEHRDLLDPATIGRLVPGELSDHDIYVCGPAGFMSSISRTLVLAGADRASIHSERFEI